MRWSAKFAKNLQSLLCCCSSIFEFHPRQFIHSGINSEFSRIFNKTESFEKKQIGRKFIIHFSWKDDVSSKNLQKICNPCLLLFVYLWIPLQTIYSFGGYSWLLFLSIFIGNLLCCWNPLCNNYAWCYLVHSYKGSCWTLPP